MTRKQRDRYLKRNGFALWKQGSKHCIYSDGVSKLMVPTGSKVAAHNVRNMMADIKRMVALRQEREMKEDTGRRVSAGTVAEIAKANAAVPPIQPRFEVADPDHKSKAPRYDGVMRRRLEREIVSLWESGLTETTKLVAPLIERGFTDPDGSRLQLKRVTYSVKNLLASGVIQEVIVKPRLPEPSKQVRSGMLPDTVMGILTDPGLSSDQKVRMISAYASL